MTYHFHSGALAAQSWPHIYETKTQPLGLFFTQCMKNPEDPGFADFQDILLLKAPICYSGLYPFWIMLRVIFTAVFILSFQGIKD